MTTFYPTHKEARANAHGRYRTHALATALSLALMPLLANAQSTPSATADLMREIMRSLNA